MIESVLTKKQKTFKTKITIKSLISIAIVALAVGLPQLVHLIAGATGGASWLPMYLPVLLGGCLLGTLWGLGVGVVSPIISFLITLAAGNPMPTLERLPYMVVELAVFAIVTGMFSKQIIKNDVFAFLAVILAFVVGRATFLMTAAILQPVFGLTVKVVWAQIKTGLIAVVVQIVLVPIIVILLKHLMIKRGINE